MWCRTAALAAAPACTRDSAIGVVLPAQRHTPGDAYSLEASSCVGWKTPPGGSCQPSDALPLAAPPPAFIALYVEAARGRGTLGLEQGGLLAPCAPAAVKGFLRYPPPRLRGSPTLPARDRYGGSHVGVAQWLKGRDAMTGRVVGDRNVRGSFARFQHAPPLVFPDLEFRGVRALSRRPAGRPWDPHRYCCCDLGCSEDLQPGDGVAAPCRCGVTCHGRQVWSSVCHLSLLPFPRSGMPTALVAVPVVGPPCHFAW